MYGSAGDPARASQLQPWEHKVPKLMRLDQEPQRPDSDAAAEPAPAPASAKERASHRSGIGSGWPPVAPCRPFRASTAPTDKGLRTILVETSAITFDIDPELLDTPLRGSAPVSFARQVAMYLAHVGLGLSLTQVGQLFERDRSTVAHACQLVEERRDDRTFDSAINLLERIVRIVRGPQEAPCQAIR
jgi:hypothetical protein